MDNQRGRETETVCSGFGSSERKTVVWGRGVGEGGEAVESRWGMEGREGSSPGEEPTAQGRD